MEEGASPALPTAVFPWREAAVAAISSCFVTAFICWRPLIKSNRQVSGSLCYWLKPRCPTQGEKDSCPTLEMLWNRLNSELTGTSVCGVCGCLYIPLGKRSAQITRPTIQSVWTAHWSCERGTTFPSSARLSALLSLAAEALCLWSCKDLLATSTHERTRGNEALTWDVQGILFPEKGKQIEDVFGIKVFGV